MPARRSMSTQLFVSQLLRERRFALEAVASGADGPRIPLPEAHAHIVVAVAEHHVPAANASRRGCGRSGIAEGRTRRGAEGSQGTDRKKRAKPKPQKKVSRRQLWDRRHIRTGFASATTSPGSRAGMPKRDYADLLHEDVQLRKQLKDRLKSAGISSIDIERAANKLVVRIYTARPGIIIGRKGAEIDKLKGEVQKRTKREVHIDIQEVHRPELDAQLVAESIALQLEKRVAFRRAMRKAVDSALRFGCKGIKVRVAGRLNGAEIARKEWYLQGRLPLQTLRADIDFGTAEAHTTYGVIGVKCWIYQGEKVPQARQEARAGG